MAVMNMIRESKKLLVFSLCFLLIGLPSLALGDGWESSEAAWVYAKEYADHVWTCNEGNTSISCSDSWVCDWSANTDYVGVCYDWGGMKATSQFDIDLDDCLGAGSHSQNGILECTTGIDCSGLVSQAWNLGSHISTSGMSAYVQTLSGSYIHAGYGYLKDGHVMLCDTHSGVGDYHVVEAVGGTISKVIERDVDSSYVQGYSIVRNAAWIYPDTPLEYCFRDGSIVTWSMTDESDVLTYSVLGANDLAGPWSLVGGGVYF